MKPAWDKLIDAYTGSPTVAVADVDCTVDAAKALCEEQEVKGFPTIKYFNETNNPQGAKYEGGRDFKSLKKFVKKTLNGVQRKCDVVSKDGCLPEEVEVLARWDGETPEKRKAELKRLEKKLSEVLKHDVRKTLDFEAKVLKMMVRADTPAKEL